MRGLIPSRKVEGAVLTLTLALVFAGVAATPLLARVPKITPGLPLKPPRRSSPSRESKSGFYLGLGQASSSSADGVDGLARAARCSSLKSGQQRI